MSITQNAELLIKLTTLQTRLSKRLEHQLSVHGISFTEFIVMFQLDNSPNDNMRRIDLAEKVGLTASGITRLLLPMQKIGLVEKEVNPRDARVSLVKLTVTGKQIFNDAANTFNQGAESLTKAFDQKNIAKFVKMTERTLSNGV